MVYIPYGDYARSNGHIAESIRRKSPIRSSTQDSTRLKNNQTGKRFHIYLESKVLLSSHKLSERREKTRMDYLDYLFLKNILTP